MNLLFVCRYNRFRSRIAEALFNQYTTNKTISVKSAGISLDYAGQYILPQAAKVLDKMGVPFTDKKADLINDSLIKWADRIVIVADNVPSTLFPAHKVTCIDIPDEWSTEDSTLRTTRQIEKFVRKLATELA